MERQLQGQLRLDADIDAWFRDIKSWGAQAWSHYVPHYRGYEMLVDHQPRGRNMTAVGFLADLLPGFHPDPAELYLQEKLLHAAHDGCRRHGLDFHLGFPFPIFPVQDVAAIREAAPEYVAPDGRIDLRSPLLPDLLKRACRLYKERLPGIRRFDVWVCEGCGEVIKVSFDELRDNEAWMPPLVRALDEVADELGVEALIFAHDYFHTDGTRRRLHDILARHPRVIVMEDLTWPEENAQMPFMGYLSDDRRRALFARNPVLVNCLTDTEYLGQGLLPCILPRWWQAAARESLRHKAFSIRGRCGHWDNGRTDVNFNRLNAHMLMAFAANPDADPREVLARAACEMFGPLHDELIDIMFHTEEVLGQVAAINSVVPVDHSRFPQTRYIDRTYFGSPLAMKAVDDLFRPPGTPCFVPPSDELSADRHWRCQRQVVARSADEYLAAKDAAIDWLERTIPTIDRHTNSLCRHHAALFRNAYRSLLLLARGMRLFILAAKAHRDWFHEHTLSDADFRREAGRIAGDFRRLADSADFPVAHQYDIPMRTFADFLEGLTP